MVKSSFSLFETILSITILSVVISGFIKSTYYDTNNSEIYVLLNHLENQFNTKDYSKMKKENTNLKVIINQHLEKTIKVSKYYFENKDLKIFKYEK